MSDESTKRSHSMTPEASQEGMSKGLVNYGDRGFSLFLRKAFIKGAGYTDKALDRPVVGITNTGSAYNPCHGNAPQLIEAVKRGSCWRADYPWSFRQSLCMRAFLNPPACTCVT